MVSFTSKAPATFFRECYLEKCSQTLRRQMSSDMCSGSFLNIIEQLSMPQKEVATNDSHCFSRNNIIQACYRFSEPRSMRINLFFNRYCMRYERLLNLHLHGGGGGGL